MRFNTNCKKYLKTRKSAVYGEFRGVDLSSSPIDCSDTHSPQMVNMISEHGVNHKRSGWLQIASLGTYKDITCMHFYSASNTNYLLVCASGDLYVGTWANKLYSATWYYYEDVMQWEKIYEHSSDDGYVSNGVEMYDDGDKVYIVGCGDYLVYHYDTEQKKHVVEKVFDGADTYIPTTTISIPEAQDEEEDATISSLDAVNLLSSRRKNTLSGPLDPSGNEQYEMVGYTWNLDTTIDFGAQTVAHTMKVYVTIEGMFHACPITIEATADTSTTASDYAVLYVTSVTTTSTATPTLSVGDDIGTISSDGTLTMIDLLDQKSIDISPTAEGTDNITVEFPHYVAGYAERVSNARTSVLFGTAGVADRLFIAGTNYISQYDKEYYKFRNYDFWSEQNDFTYFPDVNYQVFGNGYSEINGYLVLNDSVLAVFKRAHGEEPTVYYRTGSSYSYTDSTTGLTITQETFPITQGGHGDEIIGPRCTVNFDGDNVVLTRGGVKGIVQATNVLTQERFIRDRSTNIDKELQSETIMDGAIAVHGDKLFVSCGSFDSVESDYNTKIYVADARYKTSSSHSVDGSYEYEWWEWDQNFPVYDFAEVNGRLYASSTNGNIYVYKEGKTESTFFKDAAIMYTPESYVGHLMWNKYADSKYFETEEGDVTYDTTTNVVTYNTTYKSDFENGDEMRLFYVKDGAYNLIKAPGDSYATRFYVANKTNTTFTLVDQFGNEITTSYAFKDFIEKGYLPQMRIYHHEPIVCEWYSPVFALGSTLYSKSLLDIAVTSEPEVTGVYQFGFDTKNSLSEFSTHGSGGFSFDDLSFENFYFDTSFATTHNVRCHERNFNFIQFHLKSSTESDCALNTIQILYKLNHLNRGTK